MDSAFKSVRFTEEANMVLVRHVAYVSSANGVVPMNGHTFVLRAFPVTYKAYQPVKQDFRWPLIHIKVKHPFRFNLG